MSAYFPDGTWCHNDGQRDFFCQQNECKPKVADPPLPARSTVITPPTTTTPFYRPAPRPEATTYRPGRFITDQGSFRTETVAPRPATTERPRPVAGPPRPDDIYRSQDEAERDRWQHQQQQQQAVTPTRFPPRPTPTGWPPNNALHNAFSNNNNPPANPFGNNNGLTNPFTSHNNGIGPPKDTLGGSGGGGGSGDGGGGWFFSSDQPRTTERSLLPWFFNSNPPRLSETTPSGRWFFPDVLTVASTTESSWLFGADTGRALDSDWASASRLRGRSAGPGWGREARRLQDSSGWPPNSGQRGRTGRVLWPGQGRQERQERQGRQERQELTRRERQDLVRREPGVEVPRRERQTASGSGSGGDRAGAGGAVRWPESGESTRWRVRPTMPTLPPPALQRRSGEAAAGGGLLGSVTGLWCRLVSSCD